MKRLVVKLNDVKQMENLIKEIEKRYPEAKLVYNSNNVGRPTASLSEIKLFLREILQKGGVEVTEIMKEAKKKKMRKSTIKLLRKEMRIKSFVDYDRRYWEWTSESRLDV